jgi:hypothetical protein
MIYDHWGPISLPWLGRGVIYVSIFFSVYSAAQYSLAFIAKMKEKVSAGMRNRMAHFKARRSQRRQRRKAKHEGPTNP